MLKDVNVLSVEEVSEYVVVSSDVFEVSGAVSYTHLTLPTTPYV